MGRSRQAQLSIFLLLGVVLVLIFGFLFYLRADYISSIFRQSGSSTLNPSQIQEEVTLRIEGCLQASTRAALIDVGRQGGIIYDYQVEGTAPFYAPSTSPPAPYAEYFLPYDEHNVSFGVRKSGELLPPQYPHNGPLGSVSLASVIGKNSLKPLCDSEGPNAWNRVGAEHTCMTYDSPGSNQSVQDYLRIYTLNLTKRCIDLSKMQDEMGIKITEQGEADLEVVLGDTDIVVNLEYPLDISGPVTSSVESFSFQSNVRLKKIYELAHRLIAKDISDITFNLDDPLAVAGLRTCPSPDRTNTNEFCLKDDMNVTIVQNPCVNLGKCTANVFSTMIRIEDSRTLLEGKPYAFQFIRENRRPALDLINEDGLGGESIYELQSSFGLDPDQVYLKTKKNPYPDNYDIVLSAGDIIDLIPVAFDPDENDLTFTYHGWKTPTKLQDTRDLMCPSGSNPVCIASSGSRTTKCLTPTQITSYAVKGSIIANAPCTGVSFCDVTMKHQRDDSCYMYSSSDAVDPFYNTPLDPGSEGGGTTTNHWHDVSPKFASTGFRVTDYETKEPASGSPGDVGYKIVRVMVQDTEGLADWQDIRILINDPPTFEPQVAGGCTDAGYEFTVDCSEDRYFADYRLEIEYDGGVCVNITNSTCTFSASYGALGDRCADKLPRDLTVRVTDDFGESVERPYSVCGP